MESEAGRGNTTIAKGQFSLAVGKMMKKWRANLHSSTEMCSKGNFVKIRDTMGFIGTKMAMSTRALGKIS